MAAAARRGAARRRGFAVEDRRCYCTREVVVSGEVAVVAPALMAATPWHSDGAFYIILPLHSPAPPLPARVTARGGPGCHDPAHSVQQMTELPVRQFSV